MKENIDQSRMLPTQSGTRMSQGLAGVGKAAREKKQEQFTSLLHHLTTSLLRDSFYALKRGASPGIDGVRWQEYESGLEGRLADLHSRVHRGTYRAQPSRRVYIPKSVRAFLAVYGSIRRPAADVYGARPRSQLAQPVIDETEASNMKLNEPSQTAIMVARQRAAHQVLDSGSILFDPFAMKILGEDETDVIQFANRHPMVSFGRVFTTARSRIAEEASSEAVERGVQQIVILGAGLDTFALRNPHGTREIRIYEVDHPATQAWKRGRLAEAQITVPPSMIFVSVDFERDDMGEKLVAAGFQQNSPAFFTWFGVVPYLTREAINGALNFMSSIQNSEVVFD